MTLSEAEKIAKLIETEHGRPDCVGRLCKEFNDAFPEYEWGMDDDGTVSVWPRDPQPDDEGAMTLCSHEIAKA
jgi:hypothetical protein